MIDFDALFPYVYIPYVLEELLMNSGVITVDGKSTVIGSSLDAHVMNTEVNNAAVDLNEIATDGESTVIGPSLDAHVMNTELNNAADSNNNVLVGIKYVYSGLGYVYKMNL